MNSNDDSLSIALVSRLIKQNRPSWLHTFTAVFAGAFLAGLLLLFGIRLYLHWSVKDTLERSRTTERSR